MVVPLALLMIFSLLYLTYGNTVDTLRVATGIPFAWVGGLIALWIRDMPFSISAAIGFVALSGVAVLADMILVSYVAQLRQRGIPLEQAIELAAMTRLRPILMTALVASLGFLPMAREYRYGGRGATSVGHRGHRRGDQFQCSLSCWCYGCLYLIMPGKTHPEKTRPPARLRPTHNLYRLLWSQRHLSPPCKPNGFFDTGRCAQ